ncbi:MAG: condensation domain-containing protein, partial [Spirochaetota bacterium]|nr:condensation domain-containing protein [Spirochaetota bacterium]
MAVNRVSSNIEDIYSLSPMQKGMLFHCLYAPDSYIYSERSTLTIEGGLDIDALKRAWEHLCQSHPLFRTVFKWENVNDLIQIVLKKKSPGFEIYDLSSFDEDERSKRKKDLLDADKRKNFDLAKGPLMRLNVLILGNNKFFISWSYHHILIDGWCQSLVMRDLFVSYIAIKGGEPLPDIRRPQYKHYINWLKKQDTGASNRYWAELLQDFNQPTSISIENRSKDPINVEIAKHTILLSEDVTTALQECGRLMHVTLNTLIQGAWAILLSRYSMQEDVVFGVTISGRPSSLPGSDEMIGLFINTLPVRARIDRFDTLQDLLTDLQSQSLRIQEFGYSLLTDVKACSAVPGDVDLFKSIIVYENYPTDFKDIVDDGSMRIIDNSIEEMTSFDLALLVIPGSQLEMTLQYATDLFDSAMISRVLFHLEQILRVLVSDPGLSVSDVDMLTSDER